MDDTPNPKQELEDLGFVFEEEGEHLVGALEDEAKRLRRVLALIEEWLLHL